MRTAAHRRPKWPRCLSSETSREFCACLEALSDGSRSGMGLCAEEPRRDCRRSPARATALTQAGDGKEGSRRSVSTEGHCAPRVPPSLSSLNARVESSFFGAKERPPHLFRVLHLWRFLYRAVDPTRAGSQVIREVASIPLFWEPSVADASAAWLGGRSARYPGGASCAGWPPAAEHEAELQISGINPARGKATAAGGSECRSRFCGPKPSAWTPQVQHKKRALGKASQRGQGALCSRGVPGSHGRTVALPLTRRRRTACMRASWSAARGLGRLS